MIFRGHLPGLDVLRGVAIALILIYHGFDLRVPFAQFSGVSKAFVYLTSWGPTGVPLFFVLSGFLISGIVLDGRPMRRAEFFKSFYRRRALRILPAYVVMLALLKTLDIISWKFVLAAILFIANMASLVGAESGEYFTFWSIAVEEQFYILWPWLLRATSTRRLAIVAIGMTGIVLAMQLMAPRWFPHLDLRYKLWGNIPSLMAGALIAIGLRTGSIRRATVGRYIAGCLAGLCLTMPIIYLVDTALLPAVRGLYRLPFIFAFSAALLGIVARHEPGIRIASPTGRFFAFLGYVSYGLYLVHQLLFTLYERALSGTWFAGRDIARLGIEWLLCVSAAVMLSYLSRQFFEAWFLRKPLLPVPLDLP